MIDTFLATIYFCLLSFLIVKISKCLNECQKYLPLCGDISDKVNVTQPLDYVAHKESMEKR